MEVIIVEVDMADMDVAVAEVVEAEVVDLVLVVRVAKIMQLRTKLFLEELISQIVKCKMTVK